MAAGDAAMAVALADSVLFNLSADAARTKVLLFLGISFVPFLFVAPLIGPAIDRMRGGRRLVIQIVAVLRVLLSVLMALHTDDLLLFPLAFAAMVLQKTYAISKNALVPSVVSSEVELVEANSKLGLISGLVGVIAVVPAGILQKTVGATGTLLYGAVLFVIAFVNATRLPREVVASTGADQTEKAELNSAGVVLASNAMMLLRASVGFTFFHLFFWFRRDEGFIWFGLAIGVSSIMTMVGNAIAPRVRHHLREETMLVGALALIAVTGVLTAIFGGVASGVVLAGVVNFAAAIGRLAFDSIVQRDAPDANQGRAFAKFETRFQLGWVVAATVPVLIRIPGAVGFLLVGLLALAATVSYTLGARVMRQGRPPTRPLQSLRLWVIGPPKRKVPPPPRQAPRSGS